MTCDRRQICFLICSFRKIGDPRQLPERTLLCSPSFRGPRLRLSMIEASNFRSYRERFEVALGKPINILIGRNNTGKSNLLEFLRWVQQLGSAGLGSPG